MSPFSSFNGGNMSKSKRIEKEFTNHLGQTIRPGDKVIAMTQGFNKSFKVKVAEYVGYHTVQRKNRHAQSLHDDSVVSSVIVRAEHTGTFWNGEKHRYEKRTRIRLSALPCQRIYPFVSTE